MKDKKLSDENLQKVSGGAVFPEAVPPISHEDGGGAIYNVDTAEDCPIVKPETDGRFH